MTATCHAVPLIAIVGYSNSGKTTLMEKLIPCLTAKGLAVCSIKHSHHQPDMGSQGKDSWRHKQAGAQGALFIGPKRLLLEQDLPKALPAPQILADTYFSNADLVLVEGFASMPCPKIEVVRQASSGLRCHPDTLLAVATDVAGLDVHTTMLDLNNVDAVAGFILQCVAKEHKHG